MKDSISYGNDETKLSDEQAFADVKGISEGDVTPRHLLRFAKVILLVIAVMFSLAAISELISPNNSVFEAMTILVDATFKASSEAFVIAPTKSDYINNQT